MATSVTSEIIADSGFVCDCEESMRSACAGGQFHGEHEGKRYCVLHFPGKEKSAYFKLVFERKIENKDFNFAGVWFPDALALGGFNFSATANFSNVTFSEAVDFRFATFHDEVFFSRASFAEADFAHATFKNLAYFIYACFNGAAHFTNTSFNSMVLFRNAIFRNYVSFADLRGEPVFVDSSQLDLQFARIEKPEHISFHTVTLRPYWFVNVDPRKFEFTNVDWRWRSTREEIESLQEDHVSSPHRMLAIACRHLAVNAEENHRYEEGSKFRYMAMDARRLEHFRGFAFWRLSWWYWLASGYGERVLRAAVVLFGILLVSAALYTQVGFVRWEPRINSESEAATAKRDESGAPLKLSRALTYSAAVMTFQRPEPRPATITAQTIVLLETILGPVQAALLALAIRRKFMR